MKKAAEQTIEITLKHREVRSGPSLWVSRLLHEQGPISTNKIWDEFLKDHTVSKDLIKSKTYLKDRIIATMHQQGKIMQAAPKDMPRLKKAGWQLVPHIAFKNVAPEVLAEISPLPALNNEKYKEYLRNNQIPYDF